MHIDHINKYIFFTFGPYFKHTSAFDLSSTTLLCPHLETTKLCHCKLSCPTNYYQLFIAIPTKHFLPYSPFCRVSSA